MRIRTLTMNPALDVGASIATLEPFAKLRSSEDRHEPGGGGINAARAIRRMGHDVLAVFPGDDVVGRQVEELLDEEGVCCERLRIEGAMTRENFSVYVRDRAELYHFVLPGPRLQREQGEAALERILADTPAPEWIVASGSLPRGIDADFYGRLADGAAALGARLVLDTSGPALRRTLHHPVFAAKPNLAEFEELMGIRADPEDLPPLIEAGRQLIADTSLEVLLLTLGAQGALLVSADTSVWARAPQVEAVSPVGSGDSFLGVFTASLIDGMPLHRALHRAVAAGTSAARTPGSKLFVPEEVATLEKTVRELSAQ